MKKLLLILLIATANINAQCWESINVGEMHVLGIQTNGTLWAWGFSGDYGALGLGNNWIYPTPMQVGTATDWKEVSAGKTHSFGIKDNGTLWAWGSNSKGQLGTGSSAPFSLSPVQVGTSTWKMVKAGVYFTLGIKSNGTLWAWGDNQEATLGDGTFVNKSVPTQIGTASNWKSIDCNLARSIAIKEDGTLWVWGLNGPDLGTGAGSSTTHITVPTQVGTETNWKAATAGFGFFLALKTDHTLWAWGGGDNGQLGNGGITSTHSPTQIGTATDWQTIDSDSQSSFAIKADGTLWAWGRNSYGALGNGTQTNLLIPTQIGIATDWQLISTGTATTSALKTDGSLYSWGYNEFGSIGDGTYVDKLSPELITTCTLGVDDFNTKKVNLYPNPVQNRLFINNEETQEYEIYSILGAKISNGTLGIGNSIDCSGLSSGVYLLNLTDGSGNVSVLKFVKE